MPLAKYQINQSSFDPTRCQLAACNFPELSGAPQIKHNRGTSLTIAANLENNQLPKVTPREKVSSLKKDQSTAIISKAKIAKETIKEPGVIVALGAIPYTASQSFLGALISIAATILTIKNTIREKTGNPTQKKTSKIAKLGKTLFNKLPSLIKNRLQKKGVALDVESIALFTAAISQALKLNPEGMVNAIALGISGYGAHQLANITNNDNKKVSNAFLQQPAVLFAFGNGTLFVSNWLQSGLSSPTALMSGVLALSLYAVSIGFGFINNRKPPPEGSKDLCFIAKGTGDIPMATSLFAQGKLLFALSVCLFSISNLMFGWGKKSSKPIQLTGRSADQSADLD